MGLLSDFGILFLASVVIWQLGQIISNLAETKSELQQLRMLVARREKN